MKYQVLKDKTLALFFTAGVSLKLWYEIGMIDREVAIYNELSKYFKQIYFFTYGGEDLKFKNYLANNITVVPKRYIANNLLYSFMLPIIHYKIFKKVDILKTNQMLGSWSAVLARLIYRKKLVVRTGYMWSIHLDKEDARGWQKMLAKNLERLAYKLADAGITSSQRNIDYIEQSYHPRNLTLIPNYVETNVFQPLNRVKKRGSICFIGRLTKQKNLFTLLEALRGLPYTISLIGSGEQEKQLREPSLWEGMPKTLLEAMACGLPVLGTNIDGIREVIKHGENGILCNTDLKSIREAIISIMEDKALRQTLVKKARRTIEEEFSLSKLIEKELELYAQLLT